MKIPRFPVAALMGLVFVAALAFASLRFASVLWASALLGAAWIALGLSALGAIYRRGPRRAFWLGFTLFGSGYMVLTSSDWWPDAARQAPLPTTIVLDAAAPYLDPSPEGPSGKGPSAPVRTFFQSLIRDPDAPNRKVREALEAPIPMPFAQETGLDDVLKYVKSSTISPSYPGGIPIYIDPVGLQEAEKTMTTPVVLSLEGVPLKTSLTLVLKQLDLGYRVDNGVLSITHNVNSEMIFDADAFHRIGHCWWALVLGVVGGLAARRLHLSNSDPLGV